MTEYGLLIDYHYCTGCLSCEVACQQEHNHPAGKSGIRFRINRGSMSDWPSSRRIGQKHAYYKVIIEEKSGRILGAHLFGHNAGEAINIFAMAIKFRLNNQDLKKMLWAYPTNVSDLKYMID